MQLGRLVNYMNQTRDTEVKKVPIQPRAVVPGRMLAALVEGKNSEIETEGRMGNSEEEFNMVTVEKSEKGKEKIMTPKNQVVSKWEELVALVDEGVITMKLMK